MPVDTLDPTWINAPGGVGPSYDSEELRRNQAFTIARGATPGSARAGILAVGDLALSLSGMNVRLGAGGCVVATAKGAYITGFAATTTVDALQAADVTNPRRDRVVIEILDPDNGGGAGRKGQARVITGTPNASAATGGGYPAEPSGPVLTIGYVDVPKSGSGSPSITITAPLTAAAGAPIPVRSLAERDALPKWDGLQAVRLDLAGSPTETCSGSTWSNGPGWSPYTPQLSATSGNPALGSGSQAIGSYVVIGKMMFGQAFISFGSGGSKGSGAFQVTLPAGFTYAGLGSALPVGSFSAKLTPTTDVSGITKLSAAGAGRMNMYWQSGSGNVNQSTLSDSTGPWASGAHIAVQFSVPIG